MKNITIWKTVTIGLHADVASYREALEKFGIIPTEVIMQMMDTVSVAKAEENIDLVMVTVSELGLEKSQGPMYHDVCGTALKQGLALCPAEVALALREQYTDQPEDDFLVIATEPIPDPADPDDPCLFMAVTENGKAELARTGTNAEYGYYGSNRFVFQVAK